MALASGLAEASLIETPLGCLLRVISIISSSNLVRMQKKNNNKFAI
jgi:hypothetical protein